MKTAAKKPAKTAAKKPAKTLANVASEKVTSSSSRSDLRVVVMTPEQMHRDMVAYSRKVTATKAQALAFLKRIGAPV